MASAVEQAQLCNGLSIAPIDPDEDERGQRRKCGERYDEVCSARHGCKACNGGDVSVNLLSNNEVGKRIVCRV